MNFIALVCGSIGCCVSLLIAVRVNKDLYTFGVNDLHKRLAKHAISW